MKYLRVKQVHGVPVVTQERVHSIVVDCKCT